MNKSVHYHYKSYLISLETLNAVWEVVREDPQIQHRDIAEQLGKSPSLVWATLNLLRTMKHLRFQKRCAFTRSIPKPKYEVKANYVDD